ncbi:MAG TPA: prepilin-type N-terminal cleavage/methylation domain-containing protein [Solirubrobacteraceae bacterium]|jgi:prepilin-type N-terminal cleavage/methylation domain-containing protein|nr:prepilin-type N-terminal cleavage/methylation domain-containing protein [Solirubrobacteraceae bacterium]
MRRDRSQAGFTLVETLVAMALAGVILGATLKALEVFQSQDRYAVLRNEGQDDARNAIDSLGRQLLNVVSPGSESTIEEAEPYSIAFLTINPTATKSENATNEMRVRYCLNNEAPAKEVLWYEVRRWTSATPNPAKAPSSTECPDTNKSGTHWDSWSKVASYITNRKGEVKGVKAKEHPVFAYGPTGWTSLSQITSVEERLYLEVNPGHEPGQTQQRTTIDLRNAIHNPIASCRAEEINGHVLIDASASEDPDGQALSYRWWQNGAEMGTTAEHYETEAFSKGTSLTYTLEVADPAGLKSTTKCSVTIK